MNIIAVIVATLIPLVIGSIWYNPKMGFGKAWMKAAGVTEEDGKKANMAKVFGLTILLSFMFAMILQAMVIHQMHFFSILGMQPDSSDPNSESSQLLKKITDLYGSSYRTFKHGAFHGTLGGLFLILPVIGINALFENKGFKYVAINAGYWIVSMALMGGVLSAWM